MIPMTRRAAAALCFLAAFLAAGCSSTDSETESAPPVPLDFLPDEIFAVRDTNHLLLVRNGQDWRTPTLISYDYQTSRPLDSVRFDSTLGYTHLEDNGFGEELYAPCYDGNVYILDPKTLERKAVLPVGPAVYGAASDSRGNIFVSDGSGYLRAYRRATLEPVDSLKESPHGLRLWTLKDSLILGISLFVEPREFMLFEFKGDSLSRIGPLSNSLEPYTVFGYSHRLLRVAPGKDGFVTSNLGSYYSLQDRLRIRANLAPGDVDLADFAFSSDGNRIYAATKAYRDILIYDRATLQIQGSYRTAGVPVMLASKGDELLCLTRQLETEERYRIERIPLGQ